MIGRPTNDSCGTWSCALKQPKFSSSFFFHCGQSNEGIMGKISRVLFPDADDVSTQENVARKTKTLNNTATTKTCSRTTRSSTRRPSGRLITKDRRACATKGDSLAYLCQATSYTGNHGLWTSDLVKPNMIENKSKNKRGTREKIITRRGLRSNILIEERQATAADLHSIASNNSSCTSSGDNRRILRSHARNNQRVLRSRGRLKERSVLSELSSLQNIINGSKDSNCKRVARNGNKTKKINRKMQRSAKEKEHEACTMVVRHKKSSRCNQVNACVLECLPPVKETVPPSTLSCVSSTPSLVEEMFSCTHDGNHTLMQSAPDFYQSNNSDQGAVLVESTMNDALTMEVTKKKCCNDFDIYSPSVAPRAAKRVDCKMTPLVYEIENAVTDKPSKPRVVAEASSPTCTKDNFHTSIPIITVSGETKISNQGEFLAIASNDAGTMEKSEVKCVNNFDSSSPSVPPSAEKSMKYKRTPSVYEAENAEMGKSSTPTRILPTRFSSNCPHYEYHISTPSSNALKTSIQSDVLKHSSNDTRAMEKSKDEATKRLDCKMTPLMQDIESTETTKLSRARMIEERSPTSCSKRVLQTSTTSTICSNHSVTSDQSAILVVSTSKDAGPTKISSKHRVDGFDIYSPSVAPRTAKRIDCKMTPSLHEIEGTETFKAATSRAVIEVSSPTHTLHDYHTTTPSTARCTEARKSDQGGIKVVTSKDARTAGKLEENNVNNFDIYSPSVARNMTKIMNDNAKMCDDHGRTINSRPRKLSTTCQGLRKKSQKLMVGINLLPDMNEAYLEISHDGIGRDDKIKDSTALDVETKVTKLCFDCESLDEISPCKSFVCTQGHHSPTCKEAIVHGTASGTGQAEIEQGERDDIINDAQFCKANNSVVKITAAEASNELTEVSKTVRRSTRTSKPVNRFVATFKRRSKRQKSYSDDQLINDHPSGAIVPNPSLEQSIVDTANNDSQSCVTEANIKSTAPTRRSNRVSKPVQRFTLNFKKKKKENLQESKQNIAITEDENVQSTDNKNVVTDCTNAQTVKGSKSNNLHGLEPQEQERKEEVEPESDDDIFDETPIKSNQEHDSKQQPENGKVSDELADGLRTDSSWSHKMVEILKQAHSRVNPMSSTFWKDIAEYIDGKSAEECRDKWFDMFQHSDSLRKTSSNETHIDAEDDIFNSTPLKTKKKEDYWLSPVSSQKGSHKSNALHKLSYLFTSPILQRKKGRPSAQDAEDEKSPLFLRFQYKTYLKEIRAGIHHKVANKSKKSAVPKVKKNCMVSLEEGDLELGGSLSPGGTLQIQAPEEEELEEWYVGQCEHSDEDDLE